MSSRFTAITPSNSATSSSGSASSGLSAVLGGIPSNAIAKTAAISTGNAATTPKTAASIISSSAGAPTTTGASDFDSTAANRRKSASEQRRESLQTRRLQTFRRGSGSRGSHEDEMWANPFGKSIGLLPGRKVFGPLFLIIVCPIFVNVITYILTEREGSVAEFLEDILEDGLWETHEQVWEPCLQWGTWKMILIFMGMQLLFMVVVPGREFFGPVSPAGNVPVYYANGLQVYLLTLAIFLLGSFFGFYSGGVLYDSIGSIISSMSVFALFFCMVLYFKGLFLPSTTDSGSSGNPIFDFYWGTELYPEIGGWNVKQFTNCRMGMMFWPLYIISCAFKQQEVFGYVSNAMCVNVGLQLVYITKFFWWETGYFGTIDIMHDRAGFYIVWGCLAFLPTVYPSHTTFLVQHPNDLGGQIISLLIFCLGLFFIYLNYDVDHQRQVFRAKNGICKIWGKDPYFIEAKYRTSTGESKTSLLLGSGYWELSRHFNYIPEIAASICWTLPVMSTCLLPYFYVPYLTLLLVDRAVRDDARCESKYGKYWAKHCKVVPNRLIPMIW